MQRRWEDGHLCLIPEGSQIQVDNGFEFWAVGIRTGYLELLQVWAVPEQSDNCVGTWRERLDRGVPDGHGKRDALERTELTDAVLALQRRQNTVAEEDLWNKVEARQERQEREQPYETGVHGEHFFGMDQNYL